MSRIGKQPIHIPDQVMVDIGLDNTVIIKGPKGTLSQHVDPDIQLQIGNQKITCLRSTNQKRHKALHGLYRSLLQNMVIGVTQGYKKTLELVGLGYKASMANNNILEIHTGYSHAIYFGLPPQITSSIETPRGKNTLIHLQGINKQLLGQVAAKIKSLRKPEPYKGKGIRFLGEDIRRKLGKVAGK